MDRAVGVIVLLLAAAAGLMLWAALAFSEPQHRKPPDEGLLFDTWQILYDTQAPSLPVIVTAIAVALGFAAFVVSLERIITNRYRRSENPAKILLAPKIVMAETFGEFHGEVTVTVLIPGSPCSPPLWPSTQSCMSCSRPSRHCPSSIPWIGCP